MTMLKQVVAVAVLAMGLSVQAVAESFNAAGGEHSAMGEMRSELTIAHPIKLDRKTLGLAALVDTLPFADSVESEDDTNQVWVSAPLDYTFMQPLGEFERGAYMSDAVLTE